ncbi:MAG: hypothetical protein RugAbin2_00805 [Rugosibacter sp.]|jgi:hypothetical protein|nr:hypothetical protein [Rugosibacter sp.]
MNKHKKKVSSLALALGICSSVVFAQESESQGIQPLANQNDNYFKLGGYVRAWASWNMKDTPETTQDDKGKLSMLRTSLSLNGTAKTGPLEWKAVVRTDYENLTKYQRELQDIVRVGTPGGPGSDMKKELRGTDLREFYVDTQIGDRVQLRFGKQQVVWGETDFFHPTDVLQGFDYRWRQFLEPESDELRKPLIMANMRIDVPEANGSLQVIVRPGWDRKKDIGNSYDLYGGRWMPQPFRGQDFLALLPYDHEHPKGDYKDTTGGLRWTGVTDKFNYSLSYLTTFQGDPTVNPISNPYAKAPTGLIGNFFFPKISVVSASISGDIPAIDTILNGEVAVHRGVLFNTNSSPTWGVLPPGWGPVLKKNVVKTTIRADKQLRLMDLLGTNQASLASVQIFDSWVQGFKDTDDAVAFAGYSAKLKKHDTIVTAFITLNYMNSKLNPQLAVGKNISTGDAFLIPSVSYQYGNHWRFLAEMDIFSPRHARSSPAEVAPESYPLADFTANHDQFLLRATYQF